MSPENKPTVERGNDYEAEKVSQGYAIYFKSLEEAEATVVDYWKLATANPHLMGKFESGVFKPSQELTIGGGGRTSILSNIDEEKKAHGWNYALVITGNGQDLSEQSIEAIRTLGFPY